MYSIKTWLGLLTLVSLAALGWKSNSALAGAKKEAKGHVNNDKTIRTYMNFAKDLDPAHILTMADLEISVALGSTLVTFNRERQPVSALAEKWIVGPNEIVFHLKPNLKWSDGSPITAKDFQVSLERAKQAHRSDLKALFDSVENIEARSQLELVFKGKPGSLTNGLLLKLTEPMYSLLAIKNGKIDFTKSSGPFQVVEKTEQALTLVKNPHWLLSHPEMPDGVEIRRPIQGQDLIQSFKEDDWANLVSGTSLIRAELLNELTQAGFKTWQRSLDRVFSLYPSQAFLVSGNASVALKLAKKLQPEQVLPGYGGFVRAEQYFPRGYELWSAKAPQLKEMDARPIRSLRVIIPESPYASALAKGLSKSIKSAVAITPEIEIIPLPALDGRMKLGNFDILATGIAVADPNFEGAMSFFFERKPPFIQSGPKPLDFATQITGARNLPLIRDRAMRMREIILGAQEAGFVIPLFHFSSLAIAKSGIDLSEIPNTDETVMFSKVRMR